MYLVRLILHRTPKPAPAYRWCAEFTAPGVVRVTPLVNQEQS